MSHKLYWVWLSSVPGVGAVKARKLLEHFGEPLNIWNATKTQLLEMSFLNKVDIDNLLDENIKQNANFYIENIEKLGIIIVTINDEAYPYYLKNIYDPPVVLYVRGEIKKNDRYVGMVGSRRASSYGREMARKIAFELTRAGITVVSGLARGIDSYAHRGALEAGGATVAVIGCGLDIVYPPENKKLMEDIVLKGCCISEYLPGTNPCGGNFPARNRIISGLSLGVVVIEAGEKSGSLITANFALDQGREVFALPGNVSSINSKGTNKLIKEGAKIVTGIDDILEEIEYNYKNENFKKTFSDELINDTLFNELDEDEKKIVLCLKTEPLNIDQISENIGLGVNVTGSVLIMLELKGIVEKLPGNIYKLRLI